MLARELAGVINTSVIAATLDEVATDYPDMDTDKYGYEVVPVEELLRSYAEVLIEQTEAYLVLEALSTCSTLLSTEDIHGCPVDRDEAFEAVLVDVGRQIKHPEVERRIEAEAGDGQKTVGEVEKPVAGRG